MDGPRAFLHYRRIATVGQQCSVPACRDRREERLALPVERRVERDQVLEGGAERRVDRQLVPGDERRATVLGADGAVGAAHRPHDPADHVLEPRPPALDVGAHDRHALAARDQVADHAGEPLAAAVVDLPHGGPGRARLAAERVERRVEPLREGARCADRPARAGFGPAQRPEHEPRLDRAVPFVQLKAHGGVEAVLDRLGKRARGHAEGDGPGARAAAGDGEARVLAVLPHAPHLVHARGGDQQRGRRIAVAERAQLLELLGERDAEPVRPDHRVDPLDRDEVVRRQHRSGVPHERLAEGLDSRGLDLESSGRLVPAEAQ